MNAASGTGYRIAEHARLDARNTFGVRASAPMLVEATEAAALTELFGYAMLRDASTLVLGGGSNLLFAGNAPGAALALEINDRPVRAKAVADGVAWFDFAEVCEGPRSSADYIELARDFHTVLLSDVPRLDANREDPALRFVQLIDEFYDRHVNLLLSAAADPFSLYAGHRHEREFERTSSRLVEMRSAEYLAREHRP
jgi:predicted ATPase